MRRTSSPLLLAALVLAALAGFVDAYAFVRLGGFFVSFMSGNTTQGAAALGTGDWNTARIALTLVMAFVAGVMLAAIVARAVTARAMAAVMALATLLLGAGAVSTLLSPAMVLPLLAGAMGAINGVFTRDGEVTIGITYFTGNLVRMGQSLAAALMGEGGGWVALRYLLLWLAFVGGAMGGATAEHAIGDQALWYAALASGWMTLLLARPAPARAA
ncbi:YoaK family protein [Sphingomonas sp. IW22]